MTDFCNGRDLREMFGTATLLLEKSASAINSLNVFPVPDGDTGTNMLLTMRTIMEEAYRCPGDSAAAVAQAMARGALMGARGNSGVILSQILRGLAHGLEGKDSFTGTDLANALVEASATAYKGMSKPVEGTILTVIREASVAARAAARTNNHDVTTIMEATVNEARDSVARTPALLPVLREAGVVDAGGQGLYVVLEGALRYLRGEVVEYEKAELMPPPLGQFALRQKPEEGPLYGYCIEFLLQGRGLDLEAVRGRLIELGESVLVVGDDTTIRAHLHTLDPGTALSYVTPMGTLRQVKVENMQDQHTEFIAAQMPGPALPVGEVSTVAVVSGDGLMRVFASLGATIIVPGGQTMNPSVQELLQAVEAVPTDKVILLPNNPNIVLAAEQTQPLTEKKVAVVPTQTIPQGVAALLACNVEHDLEKNRRAMEEASSAVQTGEVTTAVRSMRSQGLSIKKGQAIAFLQGKLMAAGDIMSEVVNTLLHKMGLGAGQLLTIYYGADTSQDEAERIVHSLHQGYPDQEVELVDGGQPHYNYIVSME